MLSKISVILYEKLKKKIPHSSYVTGDKIGSINNVSKYEDLTSEIKSKYFLNDSLIKVSFFSNSSFSKLNLFNVSKYLSSTSINSLILFSISFE
ncbi:Uncharacterised protein [Mycoplasmopsis edwardii]|uniref:Uncharacterized protein n=1 Tax=Mycoplasmopsis edwardii TaxID=53558 RepID=A0A3B0PIF9_9BACT|nr:Uncharacterised protein [Mycoplasmopsis edwardii]